MQNMLESPIIISVLIGAAAFLFVWQIVSMFFVSYVEIQKKNQSLQRKDTPLTYFISTEALHGKQIWFSLAVIVMGLFLIALSRSIVPLFVIIPLAVVVWYLPPMYYNWQVRKRRDDFDSRMLDFVMLLSNSLRGGLSLASALEMTIQTVGGSLQEEFGRALKEHRLGLGLQEALERVNQRIDCENLKLFIATVTVTNATGGSAAAILENVVKTIRMRNAFQDKLKAKIAQMNFEKNFLCLVPVIVLPILTLMDRSLFLPLFTDPLGWGALIIVFILMIVGRTILTKITTIDI